MLTTRRLRVLAMLAALALMAAACGGSSSDDAGEAANDATPASDASDDAVADDDAADEASDDGDADDMADDSADDDMADDDMGGDELAELVAAAQDEGSLVWYSVPAEGIAQAVSDGFAEEYGIDVEFQRLASRDLSQRYAAEADAGDVVADAILMSNTPFVPQALESGWITPLAEAGIPGFPGDWPADFLVDDRGTAIVSIEPSVIAYNTDLVADGEQPLEWEDLTDPKWEGEIIIVDPAASPAYIDFWSVILGGTSPEVLEGIAANVGATYPSGVPAIEALAAGEGSIVVPGVGAIVLGAAGRGAPVDYSLPTVSNGPEIVALVSADAKHPAAARLFIWYVMYGPGADLLNGGASTASPLSGDGLPADYRRAAADAQAQGEDILGLLGAG